MKLRPLHDRVVIRRTEEERKSPGGIVIPDTATEKPIKGEVLAVGAKGQMEAGDYDGALATFEEAVAAFEAQNAPIPPDVACGAAIAALEAADDARTRERAAQKRGGNAIAVTLDEGLAGGTDDAELAARLAEALSQLALRDARLAELAEMAWFAGLDSDAIAHLTGLHVRQVQRDLKRARAWIATAIST